MIPACLTPPTFDKSRVAQGQQIKSSAGPSLLQRIKQVLKRVKLFFWGQVSSNTSQPVYQPDKENSQSPKPLNQREIKVLGPLDPRDRIFLAQAKGGLQAAFKPITEESRKSSEFLREQKALETLKHPHIVSFHGTAELRLPDNDLPTQGLLMELAKGDLCDWILNQYQEDLYTASEEDLQDIFQHIVEAVEYVHQQGYMHRDIKPENILLSKDGIFKLADFGFTKQFSGSGRHTPCGTPKYAAPEVPYRDYGWKAESYSLGALLYSMAYGDNPPVQLIGFPREINRSDDLKDLIRKLMERVPSKRLSCKEILEHSWMKK